MWHFYMESLSGVFEWMLRIAGYIGAYYIAFGLTPYLIRRSWTEGKGKETKQVCDICWRDISKVAKSVKKYEEAIK